MSDFNSRYLGKEYYLNDEVVSSVTVIDTLPGGFGQKSQTLPEPIEILKFQKSSFKDSLENSISLKPNYVTVEEGLKITSKVVAKEERSKRKCLNCKKHLEVENYAICNNCVKVRGRYV